MRALAVVQRAALGYLVVLAVGVSLLYAFYASRPVSAWFDYHAVDPIAPAQVGEPIRFASTRTLYIELDLAFLDVLFCKDQDGSFERISSIYDTAESVGPHERKRLPWTYHGLTPRQPTTCYLRSTITAEGPFGIEKRQTITGPEFPLLATPR